MSELLNVIQRRHQEKLDQLEQGETDEAFLEGVHLLINDLQQAGALIPDPAERGQLRALMRFWGEVVYERTGAYPHATLLPPDPDHLHPPERPARPPLPPLAWFLVGGAAVIVIVVGLIAIGWLSQPRAGAEATPIPAPAIFASHVAVGAGAGEGRSLERPTDVFCRGTAEIRAELALENIQPETEWHWAVQREGEIVAARPATPWGQKTERATFPILGDGEGVAPGRYELLVYAGGQVVAAHSFRVLDTAPRALNLQVADVPTSVETAGEGNELPDGLRVLYLSYEHEGFCPGLRVSHTLHREGELIRESVEPWSGDPRGRAHVAFPASDEQPFPRGAYELAVAIEGGESERVEFTLGATPKAAGPPAFGEITIALGVQPDGTPIITAPDNRFDWNTKVIYAIFDCENMSDGLQWAAVWRRNDQEIAREEAAWDVESEGIGGTHWVAYAGEEGRPLPGGSYNVTLYLENVAQQTAEFQIQFYVPPE